MNLLRYFEGPDIREARRHTSDLKRLVELAKGEQRASEERLRQKLVNARDTLERQPVAGALTGRRDDDV